MASIRRIEAFRAGMHVSRGNSMKPNGTATIRFCLRSRNLKRGSEASTKLYASVLPVRKITQSDICERLARENGKYTAAEYNMLLNQVLEAVADELRDGNCVTLPTLGYFSASIGGAFDPGEQLTFRDHPVRATLRLSGSFQDHVNDGATLERVDELPVLARLGEIAYSEMSEAGVKAWDCSRVAAEVLPDAEAVHVKGVYRNLPENMTAELQELAPDSDAPVGEAVSVPMVPTTMPGRRSERKDLVTLKTGAAGHRFLPGTRWRMTAVTGSEEPSVLTFTVAEVQPRPKAGRRGK